MYIEVLLLNSNYYWVDEFNKIV